MNKLFMAVRTKLKTFYEKAQSVKLLYDKNTFCSVDIVNYRIRRGLNRLDQGAACVEIACVKYRMRRGLVGCNITKLGCGLTYLVCEVFKLSEEW